MIRKPFAEYNKSISGETLYENKNFSSQNDILLNKSQNMHQADFVLITSNM